MFTVTLMAEVVLLGNIAIRMNQKLEWDAANMKFPNCREADITVVCNQFFPPCVV
jgi:hypothetical protein